VAITRQQKQADVTSLNAALQESEAVVIVHYHGLTVAQITSLRKNLRQAGASLRVMKNKLSKLALKGTSFEGLSDQFTGPTAIAYSKDPVAAAKAVVNFAKDNEKLVLLSGALGEQVMSVQEVQNLAKLPSLDELRGKLVALIATPAQRVACVLQAPAGQLARVFGAYAAKQE
jgi:large subunit ribosomal protein L10